MPKKTKETQRERREKEKRARAAKAPARNAVPTGAGSTVPEQPVPAQRDPESVPAGTPAMNEAPPEIPEAAAAQPEAPETGTRENRSAEPEPGSAADRDTGDAQPEPSGLDARGSATYAPPFLSTKSYGRSSGLELYDVGDDGNQGRRYKARFPAATSLCRFLDMVRDARPMDEEGRVYVSLDLAEATVGRHALSFTYVQGVFTRDAPAGGKPKGPALADILDRKIRTAKASGGWGRMSWFLSLEPDYSGNTEG